MLMILAEDGADALPAFDGLVGGPAWLAWLDNGLLVAGGLILIGFIVGCVRRRREQLFVSLGDEAEGLQPEDGLAGLVIYIAGNVLFGTAISAFLGDDPPMGESIALGGLVHLATGMLLVFFLAMRNGRPVGEFLRPRLSIVWFAVWSVGGALAALTLAEAVVMVTVWLMERLMEGAEFPMHGTLAAFADGSQPTWVRVLLVISPVVGAPLVEEALFRGVVQRASAKGMGSRWAGIFVAAVLFGAVHYSIGWYVLPAMVGLGLLLGVIYERTDSLLLVMVVHGLFNLKNVVWVGLMV